MKNIFKNKKFVIAFSIILCAIIAVAAVLVVNNNKNKKIEAAFNEITLTDSVTIELDGKDHSYKPNDLIKDNKYNNEFGEYTLKITEPQSEEYTIKADSVKQENIKLTGNFENANKTKEYTIPVSVVDTTAPVFTKKVETYAITKGEKLDVASNFEATDLSGDVTIKVDGTIDTDKVGEQKVTVIATDKNGNETKQEVTVVVSETEEQTVEVQEEKDAVSADGKKKEKTTTATSNSSKTNNTSSNNSSNKTSSGSSNKSNSSSSSNKNNSSSSSKNNNSSSNSSNKGNSSNNSSSNNSSSNKPVHCTNNNNHSMKCGNIGKWVNSRDDVRKAVDAMGKPWDEKWLAGEISDDEYFKNSPSGYEAWSCAYCGKWTGNAKYRQ